MSALCSRQPGNALRALRDLGLLDQCLAQGFQIDDYVMYEATGDYIGRMKLLRIAGADIPAVNGLPRIVLHRILTKAAEDGGARIRVGLTVNSIAYFHLWIDRGKNYLNQLIFNKL